MLRWAMKYESFHPDPKSWLIWHPDPKSWLIWPIEFCSAGWFPTPCPLSGVVISASSSDAPVKAVETLRRCGVVWGEPSCQALGCGAWDVKVVLFEMGVLNPRNPNHLVSGWLGCAITSSEKYLLSRFHYHSQKVIGSLGQNWSYVVWVIYLQFGKCQ